MKVAVVGATGMVGRTMIKVLEERDFPVTELIPAASEKSVGKEITFKGKQVKVVSVNDAIKAKPVVAIFQLALMHPNNMHLFLPKTELL